MDAPGNISPLCTSSLEGTEGCWMSTPSTTALKSCLQTLRVLLCPLSYPTLADRIAYSLPGVGYGLKGLHPFISQIACSPLARMPWTVRAGGFGRRNALAVQPANTI